jgi:ketosteroid isomerase-like protein
VSQENVELVRVIFTMFNNGDSVAHLLDPDFEYVNPPYAVEPGVRRGRTELDKVREQMREIYPDFHFEAERFLDAGEDVVIVGVARGTSVSGVDAQWHQGYVYAIRAGKLIRFRWFNQPSEALKAVGLEE